MANFVQMTPISAVIITYNEEKNIERCIRSLMGVVDEIIVLDSFSTDQTPAIVKELGATLVQTPWEGYAKTKNKANQYARFPYILSIDADEALSEPLRQSIVKEKEKKLEGVYEVNRLTNYCGHWIRHCGWYPDRKIRLFPKAHAYWEGDFVHEVLVYPKTLPKKRLKGDLLHYSFHSIEDHLNRIQKYAPLEAKKLFQKKKKATFYHLHLKPLLKFGSMYFLRLGFLDGYYGYKVCQLSAYAVKQRYHHLKRLYQEKNGESLDQSH
jgi:(heptosyl)LPS beta-1,4-glucosyltransferase